MLGHRGASQRATENTLEALRLALDQGGDGVELDVRLCATGEPVVFHDDDLVRLVGSAARVRAMPLSALRRVRLAGDHRIPTLDEVLEALPGALVNIELKAEDGGGPRVAAAVIDRLRRHRVDDRVVVSSFWPGGLAHVRLRAPRIGVGYLFHRGQSRPLRRGWPAYLLGASAVHPDRALVTASSMRRWRRAGFAVHAWTADDPAEVRRLARLGVDAIITNDPAGALAALA